jgi:hypothetical protein
MFRSDCLLNQSLDFSNREINNKNITSKTTSCVLAYSYFIFQACIVQLFTYKIKNLCSLYRSVFDTSFMVWIKHSTSLTDFCIQKWCALCWTTLEYSRPTILAGKLLWWYLCFMAFLPHSTVATIVQAQGVIRNSQPVSAAGVYFMFKRTSYCASVVSGGLATSVTSVQEAR